MYIVVKSRLLDLFEEVGMSRRTINKSHQDGVLSLCSSAISIVECMFCT